MNYYGAVLFVIDMQKPKIIYIYDALCTWCYGFSPVVKAVFENYQDKFDFEVISGGMVLGNRTGPVSVVTPAIQDHYKIVEDTTRVNFGEAFLRELDKGDMILDSEKPAIALSVFKHYFPAQAIPFAHDLQQGIFYEGKGPNDEHLYRYLAVNFGLDPDAFIHNLHEENYKQDAYYDFALARQLQVTSYPALLIQSADNHFFLIAKGYADFDTIEGRIQNVLKELK